MRENLLNKFPLIILSTKKAKSKQQRLGRRYSEMENNFFFLMWDLEQVYRIPGVKEEDFQRIRTFGIVYDMNQQAL